VRPAISVQAPQAEIRVLVHKAPVFRTQGQVLRERVVSAAPVKEGAFSLRVGAGNRCAMVAGGIKDQAAAPGEGVGAYSSDSKWEVHHGITRDRVHVGLNSGFSEAAEITLSISIITVIALRRKPAVEVIAVSDRQSTGLGGGPRNSLAAAVFGKESCSLSAHFTSTSCAKAVIVNISMDAIITNKLRVIFSLLRLSRFELRSKAVAGAIANAHTTGSPAVAAMPDHFERLIKAFLLPIRDRWDKE